MTKTELKKIHLKPKKILKKERLAKDYSVTSMALLIGVNRNQYRAKELGEVPFTDYEIKIISTELGLPIEYLFFID
ncbi:MULTISPECIES: helix-turn-helix transcriptional regulator [unclassified Cytobacillus]|uniref:helix-turn-helix transcriptional regulator n=1 Tax=unclassified Cytobacillus TaxID=2675268 RepID=UPI0030F9F06B